MAEQNTHKKLKEVLSCLTSAKQTAYIKIGTSAKVEN